MRFLIYIWTQIFLMGIGGIAGAITGVHLGDQAGMMLGAGIGGVIGIIVARYLLSYAGANSHSPNKESEPAAHVHDALYAQVGEEVANKDFHPGPMARAFAESQGDRDQVHALYIRFRVEELHRAAQREAAAAEFAAEKRSLATWNSFVAVAFVLAIISVVSLIAWRANNLHSLLAIAPSNSAVENEEFQSFGTSFKGREAIEKKHRLAAYGGNVTTEASVELGLQWLKKNQQQDGSWSLTGPFGGGPYVDNTVAATSMALLAFQGAGHTHMSGKHKDVVAKGWNALKKYQDPDGLFICDSAHSHRLYAQAQATIVCCELYGMTKDQEVRPYAQKALNYAIFAQAPEGGWRYQPKEESDTSVTGWFVMALQSGMMAGLEVPSPNLSNIERFLDSVQANGGSHYCYMPGREPTLTMTAEGLLCRMYLGWKHEDPRLAAGMDYVCGNTIDYNQANLYYWYYATQAAHHMGGHHWKQWNQVMIQTVPKAQIKTGDEAGSWSAEGGSTHDIYGGRLYATCLSIYMLEVYYRNEPLYAARPEPAVNP